MKRLLNNFEEKLREFPDIALGGDDIFRRQAIWKAHFHLRMGDSFRGRVILDIGCADGSFLTTVAAMHPSMGFIGLDWKFKSLYTGAERVAAAGLKNVALLRGRAQDLTRIFEPGEVDEVWVFHPEPCAEPAQRQNRLIAEPFLADVHSILRGADSKLVIKTDHAGYFQWIFALLGAKEPPAFREARKAAAQPAAKNGTSRMRARDLLDAADLPKPSSTARAQFTVAATSADYWNDSAILRHTADAPFAGILTPYEQRFVKKRQPIFYVELRKR